jgi:hypothetical protein
MVLHRPIETTASIRHQTAVGFYFLKIETAQATIQIMTAGTIR